MGRGWSIELKQRELQQAYSRHRIVGQGVLGLGGGRYSASRSLQEHEYTIDGSLRPSFWTRIQQQFSLRARGPAWRSQALDDLLSCHAPSSVLATRLPRRPVLQYKHIPLPRLARIHLDVELDRDADGMLKFSNHTTAEEVSSI